MYTYDRENEFTFEFNSYKVISKQSSILQTQTLHNIVESELTLARQREESDNVDGARTYGVCSS